MRVLHIISSLDPKAGGVSQAVRTMVKGLAGLRVDNEVACLDAGDPGLLQEDGLRIHTFGPGMSRWQYAPAFLRWLKQNISRYHVVIVHGLWQYPTYATYKAWKCASGEKPRLFIMPHGMLDPYFQKASGRRLKALRNWLYWKLLEGTVVNEAEGLLFTCEAERLLAHKPFQPYRPKSERVVGLGVEEPPAYTAEMKKAFLEKCPEVKNGPYLLFLGRINPKKGVDMLINAFKTCLNSDVAGRLKPNSTTGALPKLVVAGPGLDTPFGEKLRQSVLASERLRDFVLFPGMLTGDLKWGAFYGCDAFVLPSHQENFGIAVAEAMACSKPVLISNQINIWREIENEGGGVIGDDTPKGTFALLETWYKKSSQERIAMGKGARKAYEVNFAVTPAAIRLADSIRK